jgi:hypothetical protein
MKVSKVLKGTIATSLVLSALTATTTNAFAKENLKTNSEAATTFQKELTPEAVKAFVESQGIKVIDATKGKQIGETDTGEVGIQTHYEYDVPNFSLAVNEAAFTTRSGYGFVIEDDTGLDYDDIDVTFNVTGSAVLLDIAVIPYSAYASNPSAVINDPSKYAVGGVKRVQAAGSGKSVSFLDLPYNTYVVLWKNVGTSSISINNAHIATSW